MMDLKTLVKEEKFQWKERMMKETMGTYILFYLMLGLSVVFSMMFGFSMDGMPVVFICLSFSQWTVYSLFVSYLTSVLENNKRENIYRKYIYSPISLKTLRKAKFIVMCKIVIPVAMLSQLLAVVIRLVDPDQDGGHITDLTVWLPFIIVIVFLLYQWIKQIRLCKDALKA